MVLFSSLFAIFNDFSFQTLLKFFGRFCNNTIPKVCVKRHNMNIRRIIHFYISDRNRCFLRHTQNLFYSKNRAGKHGFCFINTCFSPTFLQLRRPNCLRVFGYLRPRHNMHNQPIYHHVLQ